MIVGNLKFLSSKFCLTPLRGRACGRRVNATCKMQHSLTFNEQNLVIVWYQREATLIKVYSLICNPPNHVTLSPYSLHPCTFPHIWPLILQLNLQAKAMLLPWPNNSNVCMSLAQKPFFSGKGKMDFSFALKNISTNIYCMQWFLTLDDGA